MLFPKVCLVNLQLNMWHLWSWLKVTVSSLLIPQAVVEGVCDISLNMICISGPEAIEASWPQILNGDKQQILP